MNRMAVLCIIDENVNNLMTVASLGFMRSCHYFAANELRKQMGGFIYTFYHFLKPLQNKKGQKNLGYPRKKQSFSL